VLKNHELSRTILNDTKKSPNYLTLGQAAKETGKSKSTIFNAIKSGALSYVEKTTAGYKLDSDEVFLLFPPNDSTMQVGERSETFGERLENDYLKRENDLLRQQIDDLRKRLDDESGERRKLTMLLTHQPTTNNTEPEPVTQEVPKSMLWEKLFGRGQ
jgi:hypothetical protein